MNVPTLLACLNAHDVAYVIIGATAFPHHGYARATLDVDILIAATPENATRTRAALASFGFDVDDISVDDLLRYKLLIRDYVLQLDIHPFVKGVESQAVLEHAEASSIDGVPCQVASLADLIAMKRAAGRPKDLEDLSFLLAIQGRQGEAS
jgi:predicted nucleotidyltransferase